MIEALRRRSKLSAGEMAKAIVEGVLRFSMREQFDDITLTIAKCVLDAEAK